MADRVRAAHLLGIAQVNTASPTLKAVREEWPNATDAQRAAALAALRA